MRTAAAALSSPSSTSSSHRRISTSLKPRRAAAVAPTPTPRPVVVARRQRRPTSSAAATTMPSDNNNNAASLRQAAEQWLRIDPDPNSRAEVQALLARADDANDAANDAAAPAPALAELRDRFSGPLEFGTAGLRAKMGPGPARMNRVTVQQATQGLANYLLDETAGSGGAAVLFGGDGAADAVRRAGVVIGHDARRGSAHFARVAAAVLASKGIRVFLFGTIVPTPFVAAGVAYLKAAAGVMVTASHNQKEYNGYKVYWFGGSQIVPPIDAGIAKAIRKSEVEEGLWSLPAELLLADDAAPAEATAVVEGGGDGAKPKSSSSSALITDPTDAVVPLYYRRLVEGLRFRSPEANARAQPVVYTPLHGVGLKAVERAFAALSLPPPVVVAAQAQPDPDFPTVVFPNPEEGAGTWDMAFETGRNSKARLVLANDPDADRLAAAERDASFPGGYRPFSGNEIGLLLADWVWRNRGDSKKKQAMLASAVSSRALGSVAEREGFAFEQTLTGFKWLGTVARRMMVAGGEREEGGGDAEPSPSPRPCVDEVLFAFEEAIGFMFPGTGVLDKDGVAAACAFAEMAADRYSSGGGGGGDDDDAAAPPQRTLAGRLEELYARYGRFCSRSGYFIADPPSKGAAVFEEWRQKDEKSSHGRSYPSQIGGLSVASVRDLGVGLDTARAPDNKPALPWSPGDMMVTFELEDKARGLKGALTLRGSGTEPKLKYYAEVWTTGGEGGGGGEGGEGAAADAAAATAKAAAAAEAAVAAVAKAVADDLVRPEERGLKRQGGG